MQMTPEEILRSFNQANKPSAQVQILAELNGTKAENIKQILIEQGAGLRRLSKVGAKKKIPGAPVREVAVSAVLQSEEQRLQNRMAELPEQIKALQAEQEKLAMQLDAIREAADLLRPLYE